MTAKPLLIDITSPEELARLASLKYVLDDEAGFVRHMNGSGFQYLNGHGRRLRDARHINRIELLAIPPAWTDVWICRQPHGHLQATGRDARGRKQYRYHPMWREFRDRAKFDRMLPFGRALPDIRRTMETDLRRHGLPRE